MGNIDKNLDEKYKEDNDKYETAFYIILSLFLVFFVILLLTLAIYCLARKKTGNSVEKSPSFEKGTNEQEPLDDEVR